MDALLFSASTMLPQLDKGGGSTDLIIALVVFVVLVLDGVALYAVSHRWRRPTHHHR